MAYWSKSFRPYLLHETEGLPQRGDFFNYRFTLPFSLDIAQCLGHRGHQRRKRMVPGSGGQENGPFPAQRLGKLNRFTQIQIKEIYPREGEREPSIFFQASEDCHECQLRYPGIFFFSLCPSERVLPVQALFPRGSPSLLAPLAHSKAPPDGPHPPSNPQLGLPAGPSQGVRPQEGPEPTQQARRRTAACGLRGVRGEVPPEAICLGNG